MANLPPPIYLGDGVYASFDGYYIILKSNDEETTIFLDPEVLQALDKYRCAIDNKFNVTRYAPEPSSEPNP